MRPQRLGSHHTTALAPGLALDLRQGERWSPTLVASVQRGGRLVRRKRALRKHGWRQALEDCARFRALHTGIPPRGLTTMADYAVRSLPQNIRSALPADTPGWPPPYGLHLAWNPWIDALDAEAGARRVSLFEALAASKQLRALYGRTPFETMAVRRYVLALALRIHGPRLPQSPDQEAIAAYFSEAPTAAFALRHADGGWLQTPYHEGDTAWPDTRERSSRRMPPLRPRRDIRLAGSIIDGVRSLRMPPLLTRRDATTPEADGPGYRGRKSAEPWGNERALENLLDVWLPRDARALWGRTQRVDRISPAEAALALLALHQYATSSAAGPRNSYYSGPALHASLWLQSGSLWSTLRMNADLCAHEAEGTGSGETPWAAFCRDALSPSRRTLLMWDARGGVTGLRLAPLHDERVPPDYADDPFGLARFGAPAFTRSPVRALALSTAGLAEQGHVPRRPADPRTSKTSASTSETIALLLVDKEPRKAVVKEVHLETWPRPVTDAQRDVLASTLVCTEVLQATCRRFLAEHALKDTDVERAFEAAIQDPLRRALTAPHAAGAAAAYEDIRHAALAVFDRMAQAYDSPATLRTTTAGRAYLRDTLPPVRAKVPFVGCSSAH